MANPAHPYYVRAGVRNVAFTTDAADRSTCFRRKPRSNKAVWVLLLAVLGALIGAASG